MNVLIRRFSQFKLRKQTFRCARLLSTRVLLKDRCLVKVSGEEAIPFLQGLVSNDVRHLTENTGTSVTLPCIYTLLLNLQGRVLYDGILYNAPGSNFKEIWLECDSNVSEDVIGLLKKYRVRKKIDISLLNNLSVWGCANFNFEESKEIEKEAIVYVKDPRIPDLGFRAIFDKPSSHIVSDSCTNYIKLRYENGIGEGIDDHPPGKCFPLEINGDYLSGVSFFKGCYVGQELTSRTHHLGVVRKRYMPILFEHLPTSELPKGTIIENESGKNVGKLVNSIEQHGIALLRIQEALDAKELKIKGQDFSVSTTTPKWWPKKETSKSN